MRTGLGAVDRFVFPTPPFFSYLFSEVESKAWGEEAMQVYICMVWIRNDRPGERGKGMMIFNKEKGKGKRY